MKNAALRNIRRARRQLEKAEEALGREDVRPPNFDRQDPRGETDRPPPPPPPAELTVLEGEQWPHNVPRGTYRDMPREDIEFDGIHFKGGLRACVFAAPEGDQSDRNAYVHETRISNSLLDSLVPNNFKHGDQTGEGTKWGCHEKGLRAARISNVRCLDFFGNSYDHDEQHPLVTSAEGHAFYYIISPDGGSAFEWEDCHFENLGGHAIQIMSSLRKGNDGQVPDPIGTGAIAIRRSQFIDTDRCPNRGSYSLSFFSPACDIIVEDTTVSADSLYPSWGWNGDPETSPRARGLFMAKGKTGDIMFHRATLDQAEWKDNPYRAIVDIRGASSAEFVESHIPRGTIEINSNWYDPETQSEMTPVVRFENCTGEALISVGGKVIGDVSQNRTWDLKAMGLLT